MRVANPAEEVDRGPNFLSGLIAERIENVRRRRFPPRSPAVATVLYAEFPRDRGETSLLLRICVTKFIQLALRAVRIRRLLMSSRAEAQTRLLNFVCIEPFQRLWTKHGLTEEDMIGLENEMPRHASQGCRDRGIRRLQKDPDGVARGRTREERLIPRSLSLHAGLCYRMPWSFCLARVIRRTSPRRTRMLWPNAQAG